jgi:hypothetical protein
MAKIKDDAARKLATWYAYKASGLDISAEAIEQFRLDNPQWPGQDELRERAEAALLLDDAPADEVKAFFKDKEPTTGAGKAALGGAKLKDNEAEGRALVLRLARLPAECHRREEDPRPLGDILTTGLSGQSRQTALSRQSKLGRGGAPRLEIASRRRAEESRRSHRRAEAWRQCRQAVRCATGKRHPRRCRPAL